jgi:hypothetical protein
MHRTWILAPDLSLENGDWRRSTKNPAPKESQISEAGKVACKPARARTYHERQTGNPTTGLAGWE